MEDLSSQHRRLTDVFPDVVDAATRPEQYRLENEQITSFHETGFLKGVRVLTHEQVDRLRDELEPLLDPSNPSRELFHEYHANESADPDRILVHALGAWRITPAFHDLVWNLAVVCPDVAASRRRRPAVARPALRETAAPRWCRRVAPRLFVLESHRADGTRHVLDPARRRGRGKRLPAIRAV